MASIQINRELIETGNLIKQYCRISSQILALTMQINKGNFDLIQALADDRHEKSYKYHLQLSVLESVKTDYEKFASHLFQRVAELTENDITIAQVVTLEEIEHRWCNSDTTSGYESDSNSATMSYDTDNSLITSYSKCYSGIL